MGPTLGRILSALVALAALVVVLSLLGVLPALEPGEPRAQPLDLSKAVEHAPTPGKKLAENPKPAPELTLARAALCKAPAKGARTIRVTLSAAGDDALLVWCAGGYQLFGVRMSGGGREIERLARFGSHAALAGGAVSADFDGDGARDLMLGVAPEVGVVHAPGAGVYWLRGRKQGGYEPARAVADAPPVALAEGDLDGTPPNDLLVLTRGDLAAQRPGELWLYTQGPLLTRVRVVPVGLDPRGLLLARRSDGTTLALGLVGQPGALVSIVLNQALREGGTPEKQSVAVRGVQDFAAVAREQLPLLRDPTDLRAIQLEPELAAPVWASGVNVGPSAYVDLDADGEPEVIGAALHDLILVAKAGARPAQELELGEQLTVRDVTVLRDAAGQGRAFALVEDAAEPHELSLVSVPPPPWDTALSIRYENVVVGEPASLADVPLE